MWKVVTDKNIVTSFWRNLIAKWKLLEVKTWNNSLDYSCFKSLRIILWTVSLFCLHLNSKSSNYLCLQNGEENDKGKYWQLSRNCFNKADFFISPVVFIHVNKAKLWGLSTRNLQSFRFFNKSSWKRFDQKEKFYVSSLLSLRELWNQVDNVKKKIEQKFGHKMRWVGFWRILIKNFVMMRFEEVWNFKSICHNLVS